MELVRLPQSDAIHCHTGCYHLGYELPAGLRLSVVRFGPPVRPGGHADWHAARPVGEFAARVATPNDPAGAMRSLEHSGALAGLPVRWVVMEPGTGQWFRFPADQAAIDAVFARLRAWAGANGPGAERELSVGAGVNP